MVQSEMKSEHCSVGVPRYDGAKRGPHETFYMGQSSGDFRSECAVLRES